MSNIHSLEYVSNERYSCYHEFIPQKNHGTEQRHQSNTPCYQQIKYTIQYVCINNLTTPNSNVVTHVGLARPAVLAETAGCSRLAAQLPTNGIRELLLQTLKVAHGSQRSSGAVIVLHSSRSGFYWYCQCIAMHNTEL